MTEFQQKLFKMLQWLVAFLESNNLTYYVVGGTLLGAVRHGGFIPWDDDIDIGLPRPDYQKFISIIGPGIHDGYKLETPYENNNDFLYTYSKLYDTRTTLIERQRKNVTRGIYIDVFPIDGLGNKQDEAIHLFETFDKKNMFLMTRTCAIRKERSFYKNVAIIFARCLPFINDKKYSLDLDRMASAKDYNSSTFVANLNGTYRKKEVFEKRIFGNPKKYKFESIEVCGPEFFDEYLTQLYKNWKELPPENKRGIQHDFVNIDLNKAYMGGDF